MKFKLLLEEQMLIEANLRKIAVFDIDNTLLVAHNIFIHLLGKDGSIIEKMKPEKYDALTPEQKKELTKNGEKFDFVEFRNPKTIYNSIVAGKEHIPVLRQMDGYIKQGFEIGILTARGCEPSVRDAIYDWLRTKSNGQFQTIDKSTLKPENIQAINDEDKINSGEYSGHSKVPYLRKYFTDKGYKTIVFFDDSDSHIQDAEKLKNELKHRGGKLIIRDAKKINKV